MNQNETGTHLDLAEIPRLRTENYSNLLDEILASLAEFPSHLSTSEDFQLPTATSAFRTEMRLTDLEVKLTENQEKMSQTLKSITDTLTLLSRAFRSTSDNHFPLGTQTGSPAKVWWEPTTRSGLHKRLSSILPTLTRPVSGRTN